jgi:hypothetical protein
MSSKSPRRDDIIKEHAFDSYITRTVPANKEEVTGVGWLPIGAGAKKGGATSHPHALDPFAAGSGSGNFFGDRGQSSK